MAPGIDIEKVKREGLMVDLDRFAREGYQSIPKDDHYRLKMHGVCAQRHEGFFMLRFRVFGGRMNPEQMEKVAELASRYASGYVHLSTRQNLELHSVKIENIPEILRQLQGVGITTRSSCGHTFRNILASACAGTCPDELVDTRPWVEALSRMVVAQSDHYNHRLPKRLNVSLAGCTSCENPALVNDIGLSAVKNAEGQTGFSLHIGGSMGVTPKMGWLLEEFLPLADGLPAVKTVAQLYILHGDRSSPAKGRLKFLVEAWGLEKFREEFRKMLPSMRKPDKDLPKGFLPDPWPEFDPPGGVVMDSVPEGVEVQRQKGFYRIPLLVSLGEIHHSHFRRVAEWARDNCFGRVHVTKEQNLELQWVPGNRVQELWSMADKMGLHAYGVRSIVDIQSCPGTSFCALAITSSQGAAGSLLQYLRDKRALADPDLRPLKLHISGCPNSCTQHQGADIGFSGGMVKVGEDQRFAYQLWLGGRLGTNAQLGTMAKKAIADEMVVPVADALFTVFKRDRQEGEGFQGFLTRLTIPETVKCLDALLVERGLSPNTYNRVSASPMEGLRMIPGG
ncbi:MAG TPA: nitrite/sulfite reductase [bacterium]|nr:nitrite/sulfite reductase [bacterium]